MHNGTASAPHGEPLATPFQMSQSRRLFDRDGPDGASHRSSPSTNHDGSALSTRPMVHQNSTGTFDPSLSTVTSSDGVLRDKNTSALTATMLYENAKPNISTTTVTARPFERTTPARVPPSTSFFRSPLRQPPGSNEMMHSLTPMPANGHQPQTALSATASPTKRRDTVTAAGASKVAQLNVSAVRGRKRADPNDEEDKENNPRGSSRDSAWSDMPPPPVPSGRVPSKKTKSKSIKVIPPKSNGDEGRPSMSNDKNVPATVSAPRTWPKPPMAQEETLPPQYRALYNACLVRPGRFLHEVIDISPVWCPLPTKLARRVIFNNSVIRNIAQWLCEGDALSLAMTASPLYRALNKAWWMQTYPIQPGEEVETSAWTYHWPHSHGHCAFCLQHRRIVTHEPSRVHVCVDCMQLRLFKVVRFSRARSLYDLDNPVAIGLLAQLHTVRDNTSCLLWVCHLEWVEAHCRAADQLDQQRWQRAAPSTILSNVPTKRQRICINEPSGEHHTSMNPFDVQNYCYGILGQPSIDPVVASATIPIFSPSPADSLGAEHLFGSSSVYGDSLQANASDGPRQADSSDPSAVALTSEDQPIVSSSARHPDQEERPSSSAAPVPLTSELTSTPTDLDGEEGQSSEHEAEPMSDSRQETIHSIMREVRMEYLTRAVEGMGMAMPSHLSPMAQAFVNGEWKQLQAYAIEPNDFAAMAAIMVVNHLEQGPPSP